MRLDESAPLGNTASPVNVPEPVALPTVVVLIILAPLVVAAEVQVALDPDGGRIVVVAVSANVSGALGHTVNVVEVNRALAVHEEEKGAHQAVRLVLGVEEQLHQRIVGAGPLLSHCQRVTWLLWNTDW